MTLKREDIKIPFTLMDEPEATLERYRDLILAGESPTIAEICAMRQAPGLETSTNHFVGINGLQTLEKVGGKWYAKKVLAEARAAGIQVGEHSIYNPSVADKRAGGDPDAWVHNGESHDKLRRTCEARGKANDDLKTRVDFAKLSESEAQREAGINHRNALRAARAEEIRDLEKKYGRKVVPAGKPPAAIAK